MGYQGPRSTGAPTKREIEVLELLNTDLTLQEIAVKLGVVKSTIKSHRDWLYSKLGVDTRAEAVRVGRERGLI